MKVFQSKDFEIWVEIIDCPPVEFEGRGKQGRILMYVASSYMNISMSGTFNRPILSTTVS